MIEKTIVTIEHVIETGMCVRGARAWFAAHELDFRAFLSDGVDAAVIEATGDALGLKVVEHARTKEGRS